MICSTLENISSHWIADGAQAGQLPNVTDELSDTWIWGAGSDPVLHATLQISRRYYIHPQVHVLTKHV